MTMARVNWFYTPPCHVVIKRRFIGITQWNCANRLPADWHTLVLPNTAGKLEEVPVCTYHFNRYTK